MSAAEYNAISKNITAIMPSNKPSSLSGVVLDGSTEYYILLLQLHWHIATWKLSRLTI